MAKYLFMASYAAKGAEGVRKEGGSARRDAAAKAITSVGGKLESFYFAFGETDAVGIVDLPDVASGVALSLTINGSGTTNFKLTPLINPEDVDAASKKKVDYRAPGQ